MGRRGQASLAPQQRAASTRGTRRLRVTTRRACLSCSPLPACLPSTAERRTCTFVGQMITAAWGTGSAHPSPPRDLWAIGANTRRRGCHGDKSARKQPGGRAAMTHVQGVFNDILMEAWQTCWVGWGGGGNGSAGAAIVSLAWIFRSMVVLLRRTASGSGRLQMSDRTIDPTFRSLRTPFLAPSRDQERDLKPDLSAAGGRGG